MLNIKKLNFLMKMLEANMIRKISKKNNIVIFFNLVKYL